MLSAAGAQVTLAGRRTAALQGAIFGTGDWDIVADRASASPSPAQLTPFLSGPSPPTSSTSRAIDNAGYRAAVAQRERRVGPAGCGTGSTAERALFRAGDIAPTSALTVAVYGNKASFASDRRRRADEPEADAVT